MKKTKRFLAVIFAGLTLGASAIGIASCDLFETTCNGEDLVYEEYEDDWYYLDPTYGVCDIGSCKDEHVVIPSVHEGNEVVTIFPSAFGNNDHMISVVIPDTVTRIGTCAFIGNDNLTTIVMGSSVAQIDYSAFENCRKLKEVYYKGTAEDWKNIDLDTECNYDLIDATRYYYSETQPTEAGNYWHYDKNGEIVVW